MALKFTKLTSLAVRALKPDQTIFEHGIEFKRLKNGDGRYKINVMVNTKRIHVLIGKESEGVTRYQAEQYIEQAKTESRAGRLNLPQDRKAALKFPDASAKYQVRLAREGGSNLSAKESHFRIHLDEFFKNKTIDQIASFDIDRLRKVLKDKERTKGTTNRVLATLSHFLNQAVKWGWLESVPCEVKQSKENPGLVIYLLSEQIDRLLESAKEHRNFKIHCFIMIGLHTSMRRMEILPIDLKNIVLGQNIIYIPDAKGGRRVQPITQELSDYLREYISLYTLPGQKWLFPSKRSKSGHTVSIEKPYREIVANAGLDPAQIVRHTLRRTAITHLVQDGVDLITIKRISGHKTLEMVERYTGQSGAHIQGAMDRLQGRVSVGKKLKNF
jgi:integrase